MSILWTKTEKIQKENNLNKLVQINYIDCLKTLNTNIKVLFIKKQMKNLKVRFKKIKNVKKYTLNAYTVQWYDLEQIRYISEYGTLCV